MTYAVQTIILMLVSMCFVSAVTWMVVYPRGPLTFKQKAMLMDMVVVMLFLIGLTIYNITKL